MVYYLYLKKNYHTIDSSNSVNVLGASPTLPNTITSFTLSCPTIHKSDTSYFLDDITQYKVAWNSSLSISTIFSWIMSGTSTVSVQFSTDGSGNPVPSWGTINLANNLLNFSVPYVSSDTTYSFTLIVTSIEAHTYTYNVGVKLYVQSCKVSNWMVCTSSDDSKWATCNSGYIKCIINKKDLIKILSIFSCESLPFNADLCHFKYIINF